VLEHVKRATAADGCAADYYSVRSLVTDEVYLLASSRKERMAATIREYANEMLEKARSSGYDVVLITRNAVIDGELMYSTTPSTVIHIIHTITTCAC
jgi:hypothetical protein